MPARCGFRGRYTRCGVRGTPAMGGHSSHSCHSLAGLRRGSLQSSFTVRGIPSRPCHPCSGLRVRRGQAPVGCASRINFFFSVCHGTSLRTRHIAQTAVFRILSGLTILSIIFISIAIPERFTEALPPPGSVRIDPLKGTRPADNGSGGGDYPDAYNTFHP